MGPDVMGRLVEGELPRFEPHKVTTKVSVFKGFDFFPVRFGAILLSYTELQYGSCLFCESFLCAMHPYISYQHTTRDVAGKDLESPLANIL
jgi:hypothetical protein